MPEVSITIKGRQYDIDCDEGQERRVSELAKYIDKKVHGIVRTGVSTSDSHLMVLTTLMLTDELFDARDEIDGLLRDKPKASASNVSSASDLGGLQGTDEKALVQKIKKLAKRIEEITAALEKAA